MKLHLRNLNPDSCPSHLISTYTCRVTITLRMCDGYKLQTYNVISWKRSILLNLFKVREQSGQAPGYELFSQSARPSLTYKTHLFSRHLIDCFRQNRHHKLISRSVKKILCLPSLHAANYLEEYNGHFCPLSSKRNCQKNYGCKHVLDSLSYS